MLQQLLRRLLTTTAASSSNSVAAAVVPAWARAAAAAAAAIGHSQGASAIRHQHVTTAAGRGVMAALLPCTHATAATAAAAPPLRLLPTARLPALGGSWRASLMGSSGGSASAPRGLSGGSAALPLLRRTTTTAPRWVPRAAAGGGSGGSSGGGGGGAKGYSSGGGGGGSSDNSGGGGGFLSAYNRLLEQSPLLVKAVTTALLSAVGNLVCQLAIEKRDALDVRRFAIFTALGFVWVAPCLHFWFGALNRLVTAGGNGGALMRMALDQLAYAPVFIGSMVAILAVVDGGARLDALPGLLKAELPPAVKANWLLWVPAQFVNFRVVPPSYQVLFANCVALVWNVYFSFATRPKEAPPAVAAKGGKGKKK